MSRAGQATFDMHLKMLIIGDSGVGKTCLMLRYANDLYAPSKTSYTIGIDFKIKNISLAGKRLKLQMWDTAGQERFHAVTFSYMRGSQGIFIIYDVTDRNSFMSLRNWIAQIQMHADINVNKIILGCKCDCDENRGVSYEEGRELAAEYNIPFFEVSSERNINVKEAFEAMSTMISKRVTVDAGPSSAYSEHLDYFAKSAYELRISGAQSWYNSNKINGRYVPNTSPNEARLSHAPGPVTVYRNVDTPNTTMCYTSGSWVVMKNNKILAKVVTPTYKCFPDTATLSHGWSENYGIFFTRMFVQPSLKCVKLEEAKEATAGKEGFIESNARGSINMDLFMKYSAEPERMGLSIPLFVKYSHIKVANLELQFHSLREKGAQDLDNMQQLSAKKHEVDRTCKILLKSLSLPEEQVTVVPTPASIIAAIVVLQKELEAYFLRLSDLNDGNFEAARRCRDTQTELKEMVDRLEEKAEVTTLPASGAEAVTSESANSSNLNTKLFADPLSSTATIPAQKAAVESALTSSLVAVEAKVADKHNHQAALRIVEDTKNEWSCRIDKVGWVPVHERENRTTTEIEWKCTVSIGLSATSSTHIGAALTGGMSTICAQLSLDMNWANSACKQTEHEHLLRIPPNTKLIVEQEVIEGVITLKGKKHAWSMKAKGPKEEAFKVAKDSLRINSVSL